MVPCVGPLAIACVLRVYFTHGDPIFQTDAYDFPTMNATSNADAQMSLALDPPFTRPRASYGAFLEGLSDGANVCIVATPCTGLETGLDHWQAASEVMLRLEESTSYSASFMLRHPPAYCRMLHRCDHSLMSWARCCSWTA